MEQGQSHTQQPWQQKVLKKNQQRLHMRQLHEEKCNESPIVACICIYMFSVPVPGTQVLHALLEIGLVTLVLDLCVTRISANDGVSSPLAAIFGAGLLTSSMALGRSARDEARAREPATIPSPAPSCNGGGDGEEEEWGVVGPRSGC